MAQAKKQINHGRAWLSGVVITIAVLLLPSAVVANWATEQVANTQQFVKTLSPLASNPEVQDLIVNEVTNAINDSVDIQATTESIVTGLGQALNLPPAVAKALGLVADPIAGGIKGIVHDVVQKAVESDAFQQAWTKTLTLTQEQVTALLSNDPKSILKLDNDGTISLPLKPLIAEVKGALVQQGVGFASMIPEIDRSITIAKVPELATARVIYQVGVGVGTWLPWLIFGLLVLGIAVANRRARALFGASIAVFVVSVVMLIAFNFGGTILENTVPANYAPATIVIYTAIIEYVQAVLAALITLSVILGIAGWLFSGEERAPIRAWFGRVFASMRNSLTGHGMTMGSVGVQLYKARIAVRSIIIVLGAVVIAFNRPMTVGLVIWTTVVVLVLLFVYELLLRTPQVAAAPAAPAAAAAPAAPVAPAARATQAKPAAKKAPAKKVPAKKVPAKKATGATTAKKSSSAAKKK